MISVKRIVMPLVVASIMPSSILAEGLERVDIDPSFLFEPGNHVEYSWGQVNPSIPATLGGVNIENVAQSFTVNNAAAKTSIGDKIDIGFWYTNNGNGVAIDWGDTPIGAQLEMPTLAGMVRYRLTDSMSIIGGLKRVTINDGGTFETLMDLDGTAGNGVGGSDSEVLYTATASTATGTTRVYGIVTEIPEIALRMTLLMEGDIALNVDTNFNQTDITGANSVAGAAGTTRAGIGDATTISFQTGIAADTLLFGSLKMSKWQNDQIYVPISIGGNVITSPTAVTDFEDGQSYTIGVGRKFTDNFSGSVSYFRDPASDCDSVSPLSPKCETQSINLGAKYSVSDNMAINFGATWTQYGDATVSNGATTSDSNKTNYGFKLSYKF